MERGDLVVLNLPYKSNVIGIVLGFAEEVTMEFSAIGSPVRPGQLRQWIGSGSGSAFMILEVDYTRAEWNCKFLKADGTISDYHLDVVRSSSEVISETG